MTPIQNIRTVAIGGAAGDGIREAGIHLAALLHKIGYSNFLSFEYPSLIRGGHNFSRVSLAKEKVWSDHSELDILIAVNAESVRIHAPKLKKEALVLVESAYADDVKNLGLNIIPVPMTAFAEEMKARPVARISASIGAFCFLAGLPFEKMGALVRSVFADVGSDINVALAESGYRHVESANTPKWSEPLLIEERSDALEILDGNKAVGRGFLDAGLQMFIAYPMTPSTSLLHFLAKEAAKNEKLQTIQAEDEIGVINMALGVAYAGKRVALGTATGGFALMQEAFSFAGISEIPLALMVSQRQAPATGVPTNTSQGDLRFILHAGHGEFPKIIIAPGDPEEAYLAGAHALNLAWKYQIPAIALLDKHLSESAQTSLIAPEKIVRSEAKMWQEGNGEYERYKITDDGVSLLAFPGTPHAKVKVTSYEHNESGIATEIPEEVRAMHDKRYKKTEDIEKELSRYDTVKIYGDEMSETMVLFWGSTKGAVLEASKYFIKPVKLLQVIWMEPFDVLRVQEVLKDVRVIIDVEANRDGQMAGFLREKTGREVTHKILSYDSKPFDPIELAEAINSLLT